MNRLILAAALAAGSTLATSTITFGAARNYDCSKAGNANKAACKSAARAATPAPKAAKSAPAAAKATKAAPKVAAAKPAKPAPAPKLAAAPKSAPQPSLFQRMSNAFHGSKATPAPTAAARRTPSTTPASVENNNPAGAIAQCKDGTYSHSKVRTGACSRHGGVAKWS